MADTLTIQGYEKDTVCAHCGRKLVHAVVTPELGEIGAACFASLVKPKLYNGRPYTLTPSAIINTARRREYSHSQQAASAWDRA